MASQIENTYDFLHSEVLKNTKTIITIACIIQKVGDM